MRRFFRVFVFTLILSCTAFSFVFAGDGSFEVKVPYAQPAADQHDGWITVYTDDSKTYTYYWHCDNKGSSVSRYVFVSCNLSNPDKITFNFSHTGSDSTYYYLTHTTLGGGGIALNYSGTIQRQSNTSITLNPTGNITHVAYGGNISLDGIPSSIGRLDVIWGGDSQIYSTISSIYSRLGSINTNVSDIESILNLTYSEVELISTQLSNYIDDFGSLLSMVENQGGYIELIHEYSVYINSKLGNILSILEEFKNQNTTESTDSLPSDSVSDLEDEQNSLRDDSDVSSDINSISNSFDFSDFSAAFLVVWSLCESILMTHSVLMSLLFLVLSLGIVNLILSRR